MKTITALLLALMLAFAVQASEKATNWHVYFSPKGGCTEAVVETLDHANSTVL